MQLVAHLVQDLTRLPLEDVHGLEGFLGKLGGETAGEMSEKEPRLFQTSTAGSKWVDTAELRNAVS